MKKRTGDKDQQELKPPIKQEEEVASSVLPFMKLLKGGRSGYDNTSSTADWLSKLPIGTIFTCKDNTASYIVPEYTIIAKGEKTIELSIEINDKDIYVRVLPVLFCQQNTLLEILATIEFN